MKVLHFETLIKNMSEEICTDLMSKGFNVTDVGYCQELYEFLEKRLLQMQEIGVFTHENMEK